ncbi:MAG: hypothetical protein NTU73_09940 [Ignavibacteriae bacterium]|nr:hypothetical protein [Ignavibacteriota bacterium]
MFNVLFSKVKKEIGKALFNFKPIETTLKADNLTLNVKLDTQTVKYVNGKNKEVELTRHYSTNGYKGDYYELKDEKGNIAPVLLKLEIIPTSKQ